MLNRILDTGISVVYESESSPPIADIVFVHGLQGHPFKTWTCHHKTPNIAEASALAGEKEGKKNIIRRISSRAGRRKSSASIPVKTQPETVFWPADLLPMECPNSRILMFGYDSKITKYTAGATNQNSILSHSKDLLFALCRERDLIRPLVFVAHSLGGIVVKEMLARSSSSPDAELRNIVESTAAVVFLGTPHRGSQDVAALGEMLRSVVSSFGMETTPVILDALGLKTTDLERAQEDFSKLWQKYDFKVKTFQEGLSLAKLGKKVVPNYSSLIGNYREHAETLQANHIEMCRYSGMDDPNYRKVAGELYSIYRSIARLKAIEAAPGQAIRTHSDSLSSAISAKEPRYIVNCSEVNDECFRSLWFPAINTHYQRLERPADGTCSWLFDLELYRDWFNSRNRQKSHGLLWLKGKPGAGKSTLMKEAFRRAALEQTESKYCTASFFFNAKGDELENSRMGLLRSLLYQLLPKDKEYLRRFQEMWDYKNRFSRGDMETKAFVWAESELISFFTSMITHKTKRRTIIFIDALDECQDSKTRMMAYFWRRITDSAYRLGVDLNVCLSSRHFPTVTLSDCLEIIVEGHNSDDIATYVDQKFQVCMAAQRPQWELLRENILSKAGGVFLWIVLVVEDVLKSWDDGNGMPYLTTLVMNVPEELETLFSNMLSSLAPQTRELTVRFFQWAILATKPLRLHEWHHVMAFIRQPSIESLSEWRRSIYFTESDEQLEKQIRSVSLGLVEVKGFGKDDLQQEGVEAISIRAGAGSLDLEHGDTRIIQVIHESVRDFFLTGNGFFVLDSTLKSNPVGNGHLSIITTCLDYLNIAELDALVHARINAASRERYTGFWSNRSKSLCSASSSSHDYAPRYQDDMPNKQNQPPQRKQSTAKERQTSALGMLRFMDPGPRVDIVEWMTKMDNVSAKQSPDDSPCVSSSCSSGISRLQMLEDDPALLSYATFELFTHAQLADEKRTDLTPFIERLKDEATWARWVALREDIPHETKLRSYVVDLGLWSWTEYFDDSPITAASTRERIRRRRGKEAARAKRQQPRSEKTSIFDGSQSDNRDKHRPRSVASFGSAGSHGV